MNIPDWTVDEFLETALGQAATTMEERMDMALGDNFKEGDVSARLSLLFEGLADTDEVSYYCARVARIYAADVMVNSTDIHSAFQGATSQAICLGILLERERANDG